MYKRIELGVQKGQGRQGRRDRHSNTLATDKVLQTKVIDCSAERLCKQFWRHLVARFAITTTIERKVKGDCNENLFG